MNLVVSNGDVVTLFFSHQAQRTQQTLIISSDSDSEAQFNLGHPLTAWLNSHWIRRYSIFPLFGGTKDTWPTEQKTPKINHHSVSHLLDSFESAFLTLLEMSHFPTNHHHDNCHPWKLSHLVSFPIMSLSHPCSCHFPHFGR